MKTQDAVLITDAGVIAARMTNQRGQWSVADCATVAAEIPLHLSEPVDWTDTAHAVNEALKAAECTAGRIDIVIPYRWCSAHPLPNLGKRFSTTAARFEFEEFLPVPLDDVTVAFWQSPDKQAWGIGVLTEPVRQLLDQIGHLDVETIHVDTCCAVAAYLQHDDAAEISSWVAVQGFCSMTAALIDAGLRVPRALRTATYEPGELLTLKATEHVLGVSLDDWVTYASAGEGIKPHPENDDNDQSSDLWPFRDLLVASVSTGWLPDLRTGTLAAPNRWAPIIRRGEGALTAAALLLLVLIAGNLQQSHFLGLQIASTQAAQRQIFEVALPNTPVPRNPSLRLASELRRLEGLTAGTAPSAPLLPSRSPLGAVDDLRGFVAHLPDPTRILVQEISLTEHQFGVRGRTATHQQAEQIADTLRNCLKTA